MGGGGVGARHMHPCKLHCFIMENRNEPETPIFILSCVWCFQGQSLNISLDFTMSLNGCKNHV